VDGVVPPPWRQPVVLSALQQLVAMLVADLVESCGFVLAGGGALVARGDAERTTRDLDYFATRARTGPSIAPTVGAGPAGWRPSGRHRQGRRRRQAPPSQGPGLAGPPSATAGVIGRFQVARPRSPRSFAAPSGESIAFSVNRPKTGRATAVEMVPDLLRSLRRRGESNSCTGLCSHTA
jgi:hypothetical protein